jgi:small subunit ribosomal protein S4
MSRYRGPRLRIIRRLGSELPGLTSKTAKRPYAPGQAAATNKRFPKVSEHGKRLQEKQKLRYHYGLCEKQLRLVYKRANRMGGDTGKNMLEILESRFDNLVWRAGFTRTIPGARQLIAHGHVNIAERRAKTASQCLKPGSSFQLRPACLQRDDIRVAVNNPILERPPGLKVDLDKFSCEVESLPSADQSPLEVDIQKVIEFYAR